MNVIILGVNERMAPITKEDISEMNPKRMTKITVMILAEVDDRKGYTDWAMYMKKKEYETKTSVRGMYDSIII